MKDKSSAGAVLGTIVLKTLGLDPYIWNVTKIVIELGEIPYIELRRLLTPQEGVEVAEAMRPYRVVDGRT